MGIIYLIRHAESVANEKRVFSSDMSEDEGLSDNGKKQANNLARLFKKKKISKIYSSPFRRTLQTAKNISNITKSSIEIVETFRELNCGDWNGKGEDEIKKEFPDEWRGWHEDPENNPIPEGETLFDVQARALPEFLKIAKRHNNEEIIIVTHYCVFNVILCSLISSLGNFRSFDTGNATVAELKMNNVPRLEKYFQP